MGAEILHLRPSADLKTLSLEIMDVRDTRDALMDKADRHDLTDAEDKELDRLDNELIDLQARFVADFHRLTGLRWSRALEVMA
jgi:hypothetical protein